jgi:C1A family cysteine protease
MLVDCDTVDSGCNGGLMDNAFSWISSNGGICSESDYAYTGTDGTCQSTCSTVSGTVPTHTDVATTEAALAAAITQQPVSVAIEADQTAFQFYSSGVLTGTCGTSLDHGVLAVGYGTDGTTEYWKVKNSWGTTWGMDGYINIEKGNTQSGGECGILMMASYPSL